MANAIYIPIIKGDKGEKGDTPVNGVDYFTETEKQTFKEDVRDELEEEFQEEINENIELSKDIQVRQARLEQKYDEQIKELANENPQLPEIVDARQGFDTLGGVIKQKIFHFDTVTQMKNCLTLVPGDVVEVLGYYEVNDGKKGLYKIVAYDYSSVTDDYDYIEIANRSLYAVRIQDEQKIGTLALQRVLRTLNKNWNHPEYEQGVDFPTLQGGTYTGDNKMVIARQIDNSQEQILLQEISLTTGDVIRENILPLCHANSITYNPNTNQLIITSLVLQVNGTNEQKHYLYIIDYTDFTLSETITLNNLEATEGVHSISYDLVTNKYYVATENTRLNNTLTLYELNIDNYEIEKIDLIDSTGLLSKTYNNDILVYNDIIYIMKFKPSTILAYNIKTKKIITIYNIENLTSAGQTVGELENISIKYDTDLKNFLIGTSRLECEEGTYNMHQYFECNPIYNICNNTPMNINYTNKDVIVDINSTAINPDGTASKPFKHISEALELSQICTGYFNITLKNGEYPYVFYNGTHSNVMINGENKGNTIIDGFKCMRCGKIYINTATIENKKNGAIYDLYSDFSDVRLVDIVFSGNKTRHIYAYRSKIEFFKVNYENTLFYCKAEPHLICNDSIPTYNYEVEGDNPVFINKPIRIVPTTNITKDATSVDISKYKSILTRPGTWIIKFHGYYSYVNVYLPANNDATAFRLTSANVYNRLIVLRIQNDFENDLMSFKFESVRGFQNSVYTDMTDEASGDISLWYLPY